VVRQHDVHPNLLDHWRRQTKRALSDGQGLKFLPVAVRPTQRDMQAVGHEGWEDVGLDAVLDLVEDGPQLAIVLEVLEGGLVFDELDVELRQLGRPNRLLRRRYRPFRRRTWRGLSGFPCAVGHDG
jgi:hypothetical protein